MLPGPTTALISPIPPALWISQTAPSCPQQQCRQVRAICQNCLLPNVLICLQFPQNYSVWDVSPKRQPSLLYNWMTFTCGIMCCSNSVSEDGQNRTTEMTLATPESISPPKSTPSNKGPNKKVNNNNNESELRVVYSQFDVSMRIWQFQQTLWYLICTNMLTSNL